MDDLIVTIPILWSGGVAFFVFVLALLIIYWLWRFILGLIS